MVSAHTSQTPASGDVNNGAAITTGVRFTVDSNTTVSAIRFWVPTTNSGTYTVGLYETTTDDDGVTPGTGTLLQSASAASGTLTPDTWNNVSITPQAITTGTVYTAAVHSSSGRIVASNGAFNSAGISNEGINLLQTGADPNPPALGSMFNGVFSEGASLTYPTSTFNGTDYFSDIVAGAAVVTGAGTSDAVSTDTVSALVGVLGAGTSDALATSTAAALATVLAAGLSAAASTAEGSALVTVLAAALSAATTTDLLTVTADVAGRPVVTTTIALTLVTTSRGAP
jgi:hypothetical protein